MTTNTTLMKQINKQRALDYCMYMMLTSYFARSVCKSKYLEKKLYLHYREQKINDQILMEEQCIRLIEQEILPKVPRKYQECTVDTHIRQRKDSQAVELLLHTGNYILSVTVDYDRKKPQMTMRQLLKQEGSCREGR